MMTDLEAVHVAQLELGTEGGLKVGNGMGSPAFCQADLTCGTRPDPVGPPNNPGGSRRDGMECGRN